MILGEPDHASLLLAEGAANLCFRRMIALRPCLFRKSFACFCGMWLSVPSTRVIGHARMFHLFDGSFVVLLPVIRVSDTGIHAGPTDKFLFWKVVDPAIPRRKAVRDVFDTGLENSSIHHSSGIPFLTRVSFVQPRIRLHAIHATDNAFFPRPGLFSGLESLSHLDDVGFAVFSAERSNEFRRRVITDPKFVWMACLRVATAIIPDSEFRPSDQVSVRCIFHTPT